MRLKHLVTLFAIVLFVFFVKNANFAFAQTETPTPTPTSVESQDDENKKISELQGKIKEYQDKIGQLQTEKKTLSSQIQIMDTQINLTELKMADAEARIEELENDIESAGDRIDNLEKDISSATKALVNRVNATYQVGRIDPFQVLLTSNNISNFLKRLTYLKVVQAHDKKAIYAAQQSKTSYEEEKNNLEEKQAEIEKVQAELTAYTEKINQDKKAKQTLLDETKGSEASYQKLLSAAQAQLSGFARFATVAGGPSILPPQPSPDGWYYNQRDERWGNNSIGTSGEPVWKYGCLLTSVAMVLKQQGEGVNPGDIAGNSSYFFQAYMRIPWVSRFTSIWQSDIAAIDSRLASGKPVIVGLEAGQYGTHFIVLKSGSGGDYKMNDPWYGPDLDFTSHYNTGQIFQYGYLN